jgi:hypothetical protein
LSEKLAAFSKEPTAVGGAFPEAITALRLTIFVVDDYAVGESASSELAQHTFQLNTTPDHEHVCRFYMLRSLPISSFR